MPSRSQDIVITNKDMKRMVKCEYKDQSYRDCEYLVFTFIAAAALKMLPIARFVKIDMHIELMYWLLRCIQFNNHKFSK